MKSARKDIQWHYQMGMNESEICQRLRTSSIYTRATVNDLLRKDRTLYGKHLRARRAKGRRVRAHLINNDPHWEA